MTPQIKSSTLYVGNLPVDVTRTEVEEVFGEAGPIKKCFVLKGEFIYIYGYLLRCCKGLKENLILFTKCIGIRVVLKYMVKIKNTFFTGAQCLFVATT